MISEYFKFRSNKLMCATFLAATSGDCATRSGAKFRQEKTDFA